MSNLRRALHRRLLPAGARFGTGLIAVAAVVLVPGAASDLVSGVASPPASAVGPQAADGGGTRVLPPPAADTPQPPAATPAGDNSPVPAIALDAYRKAAAKLKASRPDCGIDWATIAAIGQIESGHAAGGQVDTHGTTLTPILGPVLDGHGYAAVPDTDHGRLDGNTTWDRAVGPMQFIPSTWTRWAADGNGDGVKDPGNLYDAALAAGAYLCAAGGDLTTDQGLDTAILAYNHSTAYLNSVRSWIDRYRGGATPTPAATDTAAQQAALQQALHAERKPSAAGQQALAYALAQLGKPYLWGGNGPNAFDCSGLAQQAWKAAGITIPRTTQQEWAGMRRIPLSQLRPGDLLIYFPQATHVAMYLGNGKVVQAPRPGAVIDIVATDANPILGALRPDPAAGSTPAVPRSTPAPKAKPKPTPHRAPATPPAATHPTTGTVTPAPKPTPTPTPTPALRAPTVTGPADDQPAGTAARFTLTAHGDTRTIRYRYTLDNAAPQTATAPRPGGSATVTITPTTAGRHTLTVRALDAAGRTSTATVHTFTTAAPAARLTATGDLTGDGLPDRIEINTVGELHLYPGTGPNTYSAKGTLVARPEGSPSTDWSGVTQLTVETGSAESGPPILTTLEGGLRYRFLANPDLTLTLQANQPETTSP
ncbi:hypothetical protein BIV57_05260 [Mangrovactinospora gilvigrisea]|uniref:NlpC/P60 domain-containing protein n=1 Tax=Mangrovactinospora gilvigrisea TaxID=1428644 RepID=A0A1J7BIP3_9ACTN|nr:NlpC/P60 family protein [Mangrovactinospora gilvigrisea]OIV38543.1 hypothetical protein BIV57_05260 [Mangrovactinospora gilvigrisea]